jgi:hypothetical protein
MDQRENLAAVPLPRQATQRGDISSIEWQRRSLPHSRASAGCPSSRAIPASLIKSQVGRDLGVRYVLVGSVRSAGERVRITTQLINPETGATMWRSGILILLQNCGLYGTSLESNIPQIPPD